MAFVCSRGLGPRKVDGCDYHFADCCSKHSIAVPLAGGTINDAELSSSHPGSKRVVGTPPRQCTVVKREVQVSPPTARSGRKQAALGVAGGAGPSVRNTG